MPGQFGPERLQVSDVLHTLFKASTVTRGEAHPLDAQPLELADDKDVLGVRRRRLGFIDRYFELKGNLLCHKMAVHHRHVRDGFAVLDRRAQNRFLINGNFM